MKVSSIFKFNSALYYRLEQIPIEASEETFIGLTDLEIRPQVGGIFSRIPFHNLWLTINNESDKLRFCQDYAHTVPYSEKAVELFKYLYLIHDIFYWGGRFYPNVHILSPISSRHDTQKPPCISQQSGQQSKPLHKRLW